MLEMFNKITFILEVFWWKYLSEIVIFKEKKNRVSICIVFIIVSYVYITLKKMPEQHLKEYWGTTLPWLDCTPNICVIQMCP
jgi:hypothetical protein